MNIYILMKAVQKGNLLDLKCLGAFQLAHNARKAMLKEFYTARNETDFDRDAPDATSDSAWIIADDDTFTTWSVQRATLAGEVADAAQKEPLDVGYASELKELMDAVMEYNSDRDAEWDFADDHGTDASSWTAEQVKEHDQILADIQRNRERIRGILRRVTGDAALEF